MFQLLSKLFIKNHEDYTDTKVRQSYGILAGAVGILLNFLLFAAKALAGLLSHSIAITDRIPFRACRCRHHPSDGRRADKIVLFQNTASGAAGFFPGHCLYPDTFHSGKTLYVYV